VGADIVNIVDGKFSGRSFIHLPAGDWVDLRAEIVRLRGEVDFHRLDAGALRVQLDSCIERLEVQTKNALHLHAMMVDAEARAEQAIAPAEAKGDVPSAIKWCTDNGVPMNNDWRAGWDACRVEYPDRALGCGACGDGCVGRNGCRVAEESPQPAGGAAVSFDAEAVAWAYRKLLDFGCYTSEAGAMMGDRLNLMLLADTTPPAAQVQAAPQEWCPFCGGTGGHWEGCRAPVDTTAHPSACELGAVREVIDRRKAEAEKRSRAGDGYTMGWSDGVAGFARELEAALQHRGDSRGGEG
jgi:hypothetical protein